MAGRGAPGGATVGLRPTGTIFAAAGAVWWVAAAGAVDRGPVGTVAWVLAGLVVGAALLVLARRRLDSEGAHELMARNRRTYALVNTAQLVGILAVAQVAVRTGHPQWVPVGITTVFALHFLPFVRAFRWRGYGWVAVALLAVAALGGVLAGGGRDGGAVHAVVGPAVAVVLWLAVLGAVRSRPARGPASGDRGSAGSAARRPDRDSLDA